MDNAQGYTHAPTIQCTMCGHADTRGYQFVCGTNNGQACNKCCCARCKVRKSCSVDGKWVCACEWSQWHPTSDYVSGEWGSSDEE
eukprot:3449144-Rhodomonas_salina.1